MSVVSKLTRMRGVSVAFGRANYTLISTPDVTHVIKSMGISIADSKVGGPVRACLYGRERAWERGCEIVS